MTLDYITNTSNHYVYYQGGDVCLICLTIIVLATYLAIYAIVKLSFESLSQEKKTNQQRKVPDTGCSAKEVAVSLMKVSSVSPLKYSEIIQGEESETEENSKGSKTEKVLCGMIGVETFGEPISATGLCDMPPKIRETTPGMCHRDEGDSKLEPSVHSTTSSEIFSKIRKRHIGTQKLTLDHQHCCQTSNTELALYRNDARPFDAQLSLEALCVIDDEDLGRDNIIRLLQGKQRGGTYLVTRFGQGDERVLAYLTASGKVREYKIYNLGDQMYLKKDLMFGSLNDLLKHYTFRSPLPSSNGAYLKFGYNAAE